MRQYFAGYYFGDFNRQIIMKKGHLISRFKGPGKFLNFILVFKKSDLYINWREQNRIFQKLTFKVTWEFFQIDLLLYFTTVRRYEMELTSERVICRYTSFIYCCCYMLTIFFGGFEFSLWVLNFARIFYFLTIAKNTNLKTKD